MSVLYLPIVWVVLDSPRPFSLRIYPHLQDTGGFFIAILQKKQPVRTPSASSKRTADAAEGLDRADVKKPKLDTEAGEDAKDPEGEQPDDADEELADDVADESEEAAMEVEQPASSSTVPPAEPKIRFKKGKTVEGASAHFKENPYTFIEPDDPIVEACVYVRFMLSLAQ